MTFSTTQRVGFMGNYTTAAYDDILFGPVPAGQTTRLRMVGGAFTIDYSSYNRSPFSHTGVTSSAAQAYPPRNTSAFFNGRAGETGFPGTIVSAQILWTNAADLQFRTNDWTVDQYWYFPTFTPTLEFRDARWAVWSNFTGSSLSGTASLFRLYQDSDRRLKIAVTSVFDHDFGASSVIPRDTWTRMTLKRVSNNITCEINGAAVGTAYNASGKDFQGGTYCQIGRIDSEYSQAYGYLGGMRVSIA